MGEEINPIDSAFYFYPLSIDIDCIFNSCFKIFENERIFGFLNSSSQKAFQFKGGLVF